MIKGFHHSNETKRKISLKAKGRKLNLTDEQRKKISERQKGRIPWNKGKIDIYSEETRLKMGDSWRGEKRPFDWVKKMTESVKRIKSLSPKKPYKPLSDEHKRNISIGNKGRHVVSIEARRKLHLNHLGEKGSNWKGGISTINERIREGIEFKLWREAIFKRDNYFCQSCGTRGGRYNLHPHHIKSFSEHPELRFAIDNGITLCKVCHIAWHKRDKEIIPISAIAS